MHRAQSSHAVRGTPNRVPLWRQAAGCLLLLGVCVASSRAADAPSAIQQVGLVHFSHTDYGFTDHPAVCRELQRRFLDLAIDGVLATRDKPAEARFSWTAETTVAVCDWWQAATPQRRQDFLAAVASGQLEISALPLNNTPFLDQQQWHTMLRWMPEELWQKVQPKVAIQNDVNGFPRAGAMQLLDRGIRRLMSGINEDSGGAPMARPSAFWWKMPDGRRLFVYLNYSYPHGYWFFEPVEWRRGPVPRAGDTRYRPPRAGDFLASDEASVRKCHQHLLGRLRELEEQGYRHPLLVLSITSQWRIDNDPPFLPLADFVAAWNGLKLKPGLRLTTAGEALERLEREVGAKIPEHAGEWTDWWANGTASAPREVAGSRLAKRLLAAAESPLWGELDANARRTIDELRKDLCLFDEHTWGSSISVAFPSSLDAQGQFNEKAASAYRPMARAEWLVAQRARTRLAGEPEGLYLAHSAKGPWSGWVPIIATAFREDYRSVEDPASGRAMKIHFERGLRPFTAPADPAELTRENTAATFPDNAPRQLARFWIERLEGESIRRLRLSTREAAPEQPPPPSLQPVPTDPQGWPTSALWQGMAKPLFLPGIGDFLSVGVKGFAPRWRAREVWGAPAAAREALRKERLEEIAAEGEGTTAVHDNPNTIVYTQWLRHPRLQWAVRQLELWKREPRARLTLRLNRCSSEAPEAFFIAFPMPCQGTMPVTSCGGVPFTPFVDQIPGTCRDYFGIDGWVRFATAQGNWFWVSRDAPLVAFGGPHVLARRSDAPGGAHRVLAMVFNNFWYTNFVGDSHGAMEFQFDLTWREKLDQGGVDDLAATLLSEPQVLLQPGLKEDPLVIRRLFNP